MTKTRAMDRPLEDSLDELNIPGLDGGLISDAEVAPVNACTDCSNVFFSGGTGSTESRLGFEWQIPQASQIARVKGPVGGAAGGIVFEDIEGNERHVAFYGGYLQMRGTVFPGGVGALSNAYDYTVGSVACASIGGLLYFSDGVTIWTAPDGSKSGVKVFDPMALTVAVLTKSTLPLMGDIPAAFAMCVYEGQLILGGLRNIDGSLARDEVAWSNVADPSAFLGTNRRKVGGSDGGDIVSLAPFTTSTESFAPIASVFVGKNKAVYALRGPTSAWEEVRISCNTGVLDPKTVAAIQYQGSAKVVFLGLDRHPYATNGVTADPIARGKVFKELSAQIDSVLAVNGAQRFYSALDFKNNLWMLYVGDYKWYGFDWLYGRWTKFNGLPAGIGFSTVEGKRHTLYIYGEHATSSGVNFARMYTTTLDGVGGTGTPGTPGLDGQINLAPQPINPYWVSHFLLGSTDDNGLNVGSQDKTKLWYFCLLKYATNYGALKLEFTADDIDAVTQTYTIPAPSADSGAKYDTAVYDAAVYATEVSGANRRALFRIPRVSASGAKSIFQAVAIKVKISLAATTPQAVFKLVHLTLSHTQRGSSFVKD